MSKEKDHLDRSSSSMADRFPMQWLLALFYLLLPILTSAIDENSTRASDISIGIGIGIGIGGGGNSPPSGTPGTPCPCPTPPGQVPQPSDFENIRLYKAYFVIQRFKNTITSDPDCVANTWVGSDICSKKSYVGFYCDRLPSQRSIRTIASVDFNGYHIRAPNVSGFIDQLPDLALFHANSNKFSSTVPDLTGLKYFYELDVSNNNLSGCFPNNVLPLTNLAFLDLRFNKFVGTIPPRVFNIKTEALFLNNNFFSGNIPYELGNTPANYLTFANNMFTGPIPNSIGKTCNTLLEVLFLNNRLSGCLPFEIGLLKKATVFDAGTNLLTGPIPLSYGCLKSMEQLNFAQNLLYGEVPDVLCKLGEKGGSLMNLSLSSNYFTSVGYSCWGLIKRGVLDVRKNCLPGCPNQRSPEECERFFASKRMYCPLNTYIPCSEHYEGSGIDSMSTEVEAPVVVDGGRDRSRASGYKSYSALDQPPAP
ncbi:uncharacterized protein At4g06744-like [Typha angustifolia]|uniref:uncharacterized protein At4g06744-like n=1 Tax=Typha angustifolia TaxID=59011 RepID=UPI003C2F81BC